MGSRKKTRQFDQFVIELSKRNITMDQLCQGLCSKRMVCYLKSGERSPGKLLQDRILERLGIETENYEYFLFNEEYNCWEARQLILHNITCENWERAEQLLWEYRDTHDMDNALEKQFCLSIQAQIRRRQGETPETLSRLYEEAARLTVPDLENKPLSELALSLKELDLILEAEHYRKGGERPQQYQEIADYILTSGFDSTCVAKLYPKAIYFLCRSVEKTPDPTCRKQWNDNKLLSQCNRAFAVLRKNFILYYFWEVLDMRGKLLERLLQDPALTQEPHRAMSLTGLCRKNALWKQALEKIYAELRIPKRTYDNCYLYTVKGVSCINDVVRIRRKMLGISQKELCENICDTATLRRLEQRKTVTHRDIAEKLFERLGLSTEFIRTNLVSAGYDAKQKMKLLEMCIMKRKWEDAKLLLEQLQSLISMDIPVNRQAIMRQEALIRWHSAEISRNEYLSLVRASLELTLPIKAFYSEGEKYLTNEEQLCIRNLMWAMDKTSDEYAVYAQMLTASCEKATEWFTKTGLE